MANIIQIDGKDIKDVAARNSIEELKAQVATKIGFENLSEKTMFSTGLAAYNGSKLASTRRWFVNRVFPAGTYISTIRFGSTANTTNPDRVQYFEVWTKVENTLTKVKTVSVDVTETTASQEVHYFTANIDYTATTDCMICLLPTGNPTSILYTVDSSGADNLVVSTDVTASTSTLEYSSLSTFSTKVYPDMEITYTAETKVNVVLIGPGMDYEEIQDALIDISDDSANNPYTFVLMPKGTPYVPFSMLRNSFDTTYPWSNVSPRYISIIGLDKKNCIIRSDSGDSKHPCGELLTNGIVKDLTFIMTNDDQDPNATKGGYCLHIDCRTTNDVGYNMIIEDCDFENASGPCLGIGMHKNCDLTIRRCNLRTTLSQNYAPHAGYTNLYNYGVVFCHTSTESTATNQKITFEDCVGVCNEGSRSLWIAATEEYNPSTASFTYTLVRNVFWNMATDTPAYSISSNLTASPENVGNDTWTKLITAEDVGYSDATTYGGGTVGAEVSGLKTEMSDIEDDVDVLNDNALIIAETPKALNHDGLQTPKEIIFYGNENAFSNACYADGINHLNGNNRDYSVNDIRMYGSGLFRTVTGTPNASNDAAIYIEDISLPIGNYKLKINIDKGDSVIGDAKNAYVYLTYTDNTSETITYSSNGNSVDINVVLAKELKNIRITLGYRGTWKFDNFKLWFGLFDSTTNFVDTGIDVPSESSITYAPISPAATIYTMQHESVVQYIVNTKTYVDGHIPSDMLTESDLVYISPEMYGAVGDGVSDDTNAIQACINAAQAYEANAGIAIRGYGTYKIATGIVFNCRELDVYLHKLNYTGNDAAVTISASYSRFVFHSIRAITGGSNAVGIRCKQLSDNGNTNTFFHNVVQCDFIACNGNTVEITMANGVTINTMMYNKFYFMYQRSYNANIIEIASPLFNENDFYGKYVVAPNGFLIHYVSGGNGNIRVFHYCLEHDIKNGTNGYDVAFFNCRFTEMMNLQTRDTHDQGFIYVWDNTFSEGLIENSSSLVNLTAVDTTNALTWNDCLNRVKAAYDNGAQSNDEPWRHNIRSIAGRGYAKLLPVKIVANANMTSTGGITNIPEGELIAYYNNIAFKPHSEIYYRVTEDMTILLSSSNDWKYITPTVFDIDTSSATITLDASYCCIAINQFDVIQHTGKTAIVVDKLGNTIFDGTNIGEGVFHFKCEHVQYQYGEVFITMENGTVKNCPRNFLPAIYSGENEKWTVTKEELIET